MEYLEQKLGKADLHIHTIYSYDGLSTPEEIIKKASQLGLDVIAITDHEETKGAFLAQKMEKKYGIEVIIGEEILTNEGEILALFLKEKIKSGKTLEETIKEIRRQNGLVIIPHPFSWFPITRPSIGVNRLYSLIKEKKIFPDGIEVLNAMPTARLGSQKSKKLNEKVFNLAEIAGSDAHIKDHVGTGITFFRGHTKEDLRKAILERRTFVSGEFISSKEHAKILGKNIVKISKKAGRKFLKTYHKLKKSINNHFSS